MEEETCQNGIQHKRENEQQKLLKNTNICKLKKQKNYVCKKMEGFHRPGKQKIFNKRSKYMEYNAGNFDIAVIGAGHAGCEAGLAAARMGFKTLVFQ